MALHLFWQRSAYQLSVRLLAGCFLTMGLQALFLGIAQTTGGQNFSVHLQPAMPLLFAPLSYLMFVSVRDQKFQLHPEHIIHSVPAIIVAYMMFTDNMVAYVDLIVILTLLFYAGLLSHLAIQGKVQFQKSPVNTKDNRKELGGQLYIWLLVFTGYAWFNVISDTLIYLEISTGTEVVKSVALFITIIFKLIMISFTLLFALQKSPYFDWLYTAFAALQDQNPPLEVMQNYESVIADFEGLLTDHTVYTEEVLSLKAMADRLGVPVRLCSNAINHQYGESYSKYMNRMRVNFAAKLLTEHKTLAMIDVMYDAGFRSKSSFNKEFKAITGFSPTDYRDKVS